MKPGRVRLASASTRRPYGAMLTFFLTLTAVPRGAAADWLVMPFIGATLGGSTNLVDLDNAAGDSKLTFGATVATISNPGPGIEFDLGFSPGFFQKGERGVADLVVASSVTTFMANVVFAAPERVTRYTLRPFVSGGVGLMRVKVEDVSEVFPVDNGMLGFDVGGGAIGFFDAHTGIRLDYRYFRNLSSPDIERFTTSEARLSYWRASVGLVLKY